MEFVLHLEYKRDVPLYRRLSDALRKAILDGRLKPGQRLPSICDLCQSLKISRATVLRSLEDLQRQGYVHSSLRSGAFVSKELPGDLMEQATTRRMAASRGLAPAELSIYGRTLLENESLEEATSFLHAETNYGGPPLTLLPLKQWRELLLRHCRKRDLTGLEYTVDPFGYPPLREALASFLRRARGVRCSAEQIVVFGSNQFRLDMVARLLIDEGDCVAVENPGFTGIRHTVAPRRASVAAVPMDDEGISVEHLRLLPGRCKFVYVTPSHHDPLGIVMSLERRRQLLNWAHHTGALIFEDDFDCEYNYDCQPQPSLQGLDGGDVVIHQRCFSKVLFPILTLGFLVIPRRMIPVVTLAKSKVERDVPMLEQFALTDFINEGLLERHINRMQNVCARQREALVSALSRHCRDRISIPYPSSGLYFVIRIQSSLGDEELAACGAKAGLILVSTAPYYVGAAPRGEFMLYFAHLHGSAADRQVRHFAEIVFKAHYD